MKWNSRAIMLSICEYIAWLCPPVAYCIYSYVSTLQYVLDKKPSCRSGSRSRAFLSASFSV